MGEILTIGVDPSLKNIGLAAVSNNQTVTDYAVITPKNLTGEERLGYLFKEVDTFLRKFEIIDLLAIESYNYKGQHLAQLGEAVGILKLLSYLHNAPIIEVTPASLKKFATGNSQASKDDIMKRYSINNEHAADAVALANIAGGVIDSSHLTKRYEMEVIFKIKNPKSKRSTDSKIKPFKPHLILV